MELTEGSVWITRRIREHWIWKDKPFTKGQAWIDLILTANWKDNKTVYGNEVFEILRGQQVRTQRELAKRWGWGRQAVRGFLDLLEKSTMISTKNNPKATLITILNYEEYQNLQPHSNPKITQQQPTRNPHATLNEERKEYISTLTGTCPQKEIIALYHKILPNLRPVRIWNETRQGFLRARWNQNSKFQTLDWWKEYFEYVKTCPWLMGENKDGWTADLEWLVRPKNFVRVLEGNYAGRR